MRWLAAILFADCALYLAIAVSPTITISPTASFVIAFTIIAATTLLTTWSAPVTTPRDLWLLVPVLGALALLRTQADTTSLHPFVVTTCLLLGGTLIGTTIGSRVQAVWHLSFVALVSSAADVFSVYAPHGPTAGLIAAPTELSLLALPWPMLGTRDVVPVLGVGDIVFAAVYRSAARAHRLSSLRTLLALVCGFALCLLVLLWQQQPIPALPLLGLAFVVAHPQVRRVPEADRKRSWLSAFALLILLGVVAAYRH